MNWHRAIKAQTKLLQVEPLFDSFRLYYVIYWLRSSHVKHCITQRQLQQQQQIHLALGQTIVAHLVSVGIEQLLEIANLHKQANYSLVLVHTHLTVFIPF